MIAPPDEITAAQVLRERAFRDGYRAGLGGQPPETNPYNLLPRTTTHDECRHCWTWGHETGSRARA